MKNLSGAWSPGRQSNSYLDDLSPLLAVPILAGFGMLAAVLHQKLRFPLQLPGRHGLEWMALLVLARSSSSYRLAGGICAGGASLTAALYSWGSMADPFAWLMYLTPGLMVDASFRLFPRHQRNVLFLTALGGLAHATKPVLKLAIGLATGIPYLSLMGGLFYPTATHLMFGAAGAFAGAVLIAGLGKKLLPKS